MEHEVLLGEVSLFVRVVENLAVDQLINEAGGRGCVEVSMRRGPSSRRRGTLEYKLFSVGRILEPWRCVSTSTREERTEEGTSGEITR